MVSNQEKTEFLHSLIKKIQAHKNGDIIESDIRRLLLADTNGGKLYKYRAFNNFALENLENQTLHGSRPSVFNDPFDSKLGVDVQSLIEAEYSFEFDIIEEALTEFLAVYNGRKDLANCSDKNKLIIKNLMDNEKLRNFIEMSPVMSYEETNDFLFQNFDMVIDVLSSVGADDETRNKMKFVDQMMPELLNRMTSEGELKLPEHMESFETLIHNMGIEDDADEISLVKLFYMKQKPEDYDTAMKIEKLFSAFDKRINQAVDNVIYIVSLCADNKNRLMWSHYADNHKGFCIEYDFGSSDFGDEMVLFSPVIYSGTRPKIPWKAYIVAENSNSKEFDKETLGSYLLSFLTKDEVWKYEREWRILVSALNGTMDIKAPPISCIYLGALCSTENQEKIVSIAKRLNIPVKKMTIDRGEYGLHATSIN